MKKSRGVLILALTGYRNSAFDLYISSGLGPPQEQEPQKTFTQVWTWREA